MAVFVVEVRVPFGVRRGILRPTARHSSPQGLLSRIKTFRHLLWACIVAEAIHDKLYRCGSILNENHVIFVRFGVEEMKHSQAGLVHEFARSNSWLAFRVRVSIDRSANITSEILHQGLAWQLRTCVIEICLACSLLVVRRNGSRQERTLELRKLFLTNLVDTFRVVRHG